MDSGMNPLDGQRFWTQADDPWCALAACFEYVGYKMVGFDYVSHLPIAMDGSCSGIQHFSAMLRDQDGGSAVNLTRKDTPSDIYTEVLEVTKRMLSESKEPLHKIWLGNVDRKMVKRPCMTFAYSVTSSGIRNQIIDEMRKRTDGEYLPGTSNWDAALSLAPVVEAAIHETVDRAAEAMDWLKGAAKVISKAGIRVRWTTPLGLPVMQPYTKPVGKLFKVWYKGERIRLSLNIQTDKINSVKQVSSVAPNFVHSMDATHLMMVVNRMADEDVTDSFAMIHDSFGCHACDIDEMHFIIRDEFIKLYSDRVYVDDKGEEYTSNVVTEAQRGFLLQLPGNLWTDVPDEPEQGTLDLEEVRDADFFFA
jgi:DNA-directed RNA polymerase